MKKNIQTSVAIAMCMIFFTSAFATPVDQPFMQAALSNLKEAKNSLKKATADKGGHRQNAMDLTDRAISAVNDGIDWDRKNGNPRGRNEDTGTNFDANTPLELDQPNMVKAREYLQTAMANLRRATADKGGYRQRAMDLVQNAIQAVNAGIEYDRTH